MPGARATGIFTKIPINRVKIPEAIHVEKNRPGLYSAPIALETIIGFSVRMYAIEKKVVNPAETSVANVVLRCVTQKKWSTKHTTFLASPYFSKSLYLSITSFWTGDMDKWILFLKLKTSHHGSSFSSSSRSKSDGVISSVSTETSRSGNSISRSFGATAPRASPP